MFTKVLSMRFLVLALILSAARGSAHAHRRRVPGGNGLLYCDNHSEYVLQINELKFSPNPPQPGATTTIKVSGSLAEDVSAGAEWNLAIKKGKWLPASKVTLLERKEDLCDKVASMDMQCPIARGPVTFSKQFDLPRDMPNGHYRVHVEAMNSDGKSIFCVETLYTYNAKRLDSR